MVSVKRVLGIGLAIVAGCAAVRAGWPGASPPALPVPVKPTGAADPQAAMVGMVGGATGAGLQPLADFFEFTDPANKRAAMVLFDQVTAEHQFYAALSQRFRNQGLALEAQNNADIAAFLTRIASAPEKIDGDRAQITLSPHQTYYFVRRQGLWKIDFDKTQALFGRLPPADQLDAIRQQTAALMALTRDLRNNTVASFEDAAKRLGDISDMVPGSVIRPPIPARAPPATAASARS